MDTCPITGEPLLNPGQTVSHHALQTLRTQTNNLTGLMTAINTLLEGAGKPQRGVQTRSIPTSRPPLNLHILNAVDDHRDTLEIWAFHIMQHANPAWRMPKAHDWHTIQAIYQQHLPNLTQWEYAPTMIEETTHALTQLTRATYPTSNTRATVEHLDIADMWLTITPACQAVTMHSGRRLPTSTLDQWGTSGKVRHYGTPRRYSLEDALNMHNRRDKTA